MEKTTADSKKYVPTEWLLLVPIVPPPPRGSLLLDPVDEIPKESNLYL